MNRNTIVLSLPLQAAPDVWSSVAEVAVARAKSWDAPLVVTGPADERVQSVLVEWGKRADVAFVYVPWIVGDPCFVPFYADRILRDLNLSTPFVFHSPAAEAAQTPENDCNLVYDWGGTSRLVMEYDPGSADNPEHEDAARRLRMLRVGGRVHSFTYFKSPWPAEIRAVLQKNGPSGVKLLDFLNDPTPMSWPDALLIYAKSELKRQIQLRVCSKKPARN